VNGDSNMKREQVMPIAQTVARMLVDACEALQIAGSVRRGKAWVKDVELVAIPKPNLLARLDSLVIDGAIRKAEYGDKRLHRWGKHYRGFVFRDVRFEIFLPDGHSWGYQYWLRTGPGDANEYVMNQMIIQRSPYRCKGGAVWYGDQQIHVPTEREFMRVIGLPYMAPGSRSMRVYSAHMKHGSWADPGSVVYVKSEAKPEQKGLF